jgi:hypothetical protein
MAAALYPETSPEMARKRRELAPDIQSAFEAFGRQVFADGALLHGAEWADVDPRLAVKRCEPKRAWRPGSCD